MSLYKRPDSENWYYDFTVRGKRFRGSTETHIKSLAASIEDKFKREALENILNPNKKLEIDLNEASAKYWLSYAQHLATADTVKTFLQDFLRILGKNILLSSIDDAKVSEYVDTRRLEPVRTNNNSTRLISPATINRELSTLQKMMGRLATTHRVAEVNWKAHKLKEIKAPIKPLTERAIDEIVADYKYNYQRYATRAALYTGLRASNILKLHSKEIDWELRQFNVEISARSAGTKSHTIPMIDLFYDMLTEEMKITPEYKGYIFARKDGTPYKSLRQGFQAAADRLEYGRPRWHDLRHTCASWLLNKGVPLKAIQEILGHEDIRTTMRYLHLDKSKLKGMMDAAFGTSHLRHSRVPSSSSELNKLLKELEDLGAPVGIRTPNLLIRSQQPSQEKITEYVCKLNRLVELLGLADVVEITLKYPDSS